MAARKRTAAAARSVANGDGHARVTTTSSSSSPISQDRKSREKSPSPEPSGITLRDVMRFVLVGISAFCFSYVLFQQYQYRRSVSNPASSSKGPPQSAAAQKEAAQAQRAEYVKQLLEKFNSWRPEAVLPFKVPQRDSPASPITTADVEKRDAVRDALKSSWSAYVHDAWGSDEYHPLTHTGSNLSTDGGMGYTIVDALDTLLIVGEQQEYRRARDWVRDNLAAGPTSWQRRGKFNVFETVIRTLGGLLSAHALCTETPSNIEGIVSPFYHLCDPGDADLFLEAAQELSSQLRPAFNTKTGIPKREVDFWTGEAFADMDNHGSASLAEATTIQLELKYLAWLTSDKRLWQIAERPMKAVRDATRTAGKDGLLPIFLSPEHGQFMVSPIRLGSRGDSFYEYLIKQYVQTDRTEAVYRDMFDRALSAVKKHLVKQSTHSIPPFLYTAELIPRRPDPRTPSAKPSFTLLPKQDHLVCFLPGALMLAAHEFGAPRQGWSDQGSAEVIAGGLTLQQEDWAVGHELLRGCMTTYTETTTGLGPEIAHWKTTEDPDHEEEDWYIKQQDSGIIAAANRINPRGKKLQPLIDARNILRPETVESLFVAFRLSGDPIYREWGWEIFQAFEKHCRLENGAYAGLVDVDALPEDIEHIDKMETFWLSETLKYLYLLFDDQDKLPLKDWILNTEAHPLPRFVPSERTGFA